MVDIKPLIEMLDKEFGNYKKKDEEFVVLCFISNKGIANLGNVYIRAKGSVLFERKFVKDLIVYYNENGLIIDDNLIKDIKIKLFNEKLLDTEKFYY